MASSSRLRDLRRRIRELRKHMLPAKFSPTGQYSDRQLDRARGFRLLAHAEIEAFIEDITMDVARTEVSEWSRKKKPTDLLLCLIAHYHVGYDVDQEALQPAFPAEARPKVRDSIKEVIDIAFRQYVKIHEQNHGIKELNLKRLVLPIGVRREDLDSTWVVNLDQFGKRRGDVAHKALRAQQQIDPKSELNDVESLLAGLETLDSLVRACRSS